MLCNCSIARAQAHITDLTFSEVFENTVSAVAVRIPMLKALFACDDNYQRVLRRGYNTSLLLPAKAHECRAADCKLGQSQIPKPSTVPYLAPLYGTLSLGRRCERF